MLRGKRHKLFAQDLRVVPDIHRERFFVDQHRLDGARTGLAIGDSFQPNLQRVTILMRRVFGFHDHDGPLEA